MRQVYTVDVGEAVVLRADHMPAIEDDTHRTALLSTPSKSPVLADLPRSGRRRNAQRISWSAAFESDRSDGRASGIFSNEETEPPQRNIKRV
jgi:hypothetical protein